MKEQPQKLPRKRFVPPPRWKKGQSGNPKGRPKGAKHKITEAKVEIIARTGMMPLDFLTAVYRDELYDKYVTETLADGRTQTFKPAAGAKKIKVTLAHRISAAMNAAPYVHRRQPVGIEVTDKNQRLVLAQRLSALPMEQLEALAGILDRIAPEQEPKLIGQGDAGDLA